MPFNDYIQFCFNSYVGIFTKEIRLLWRLFKIHKFLSFIEAAQIIFRKFSCWRLRIKQTNSRFSLDSVQWKNQTSKIHRWNQVNYIFQINGLSRLEIFSKIKIEACKRHSLKSCWEKFKRICFSRNSNEKFLDALMKTNILWNFFFADIRHVLI